MQGNKNFWKIIFVSIIFLGAILFQIIEYTQHSKNLIQEQTYASLKEQAQMVRNDFRQRLEERLTELDTFAEYIAKEDEDSIENGSDFMEHINLFCRFQKMGIANGETAVVEFGDGSSFDVSHKKFYQDAIQGSPSIDYFQEEDEATAKLVFATPIYDKENIEGVLIATMSQVFLEKQMALDFYGENDFIFLADDQGNILNFGSQFKDFVDGNNIFEYFDEKGINTDQMIDHMDNHFIDSFSYYNEAENWDTTYIPLGINNWYLFYMTPSHAMRGGQRNFESLGFDFLMKILLIFVAGGFFVYLFFRNTVVTVKRENEFLKMAQDVAGAVSFRGDYKKDTLVFHGNYFEQFGREPVTNKISDLDKPHPFIVQEDQELYLKMGLDLIGGKEKGNVQYRFIAMDGSIHWHQFVYRVWYDRHRLPKECYGMITPIDQQMKEISKLQMQVEKDPLTGVLNRMAFEFYANHCFNGELKVDKHALLLLDLDNFKQINDGYGHVLGDHALITTAEILKACVRNSDYVGRLGGDEFAVFLKSVSQEQAAKKAGEICEALEKAEMKSNEATVTCSIGIACFPKDGNDFNELYQRADRGLYKVKGTGKNNYCIVD